MSSTTKLSARDRIVTLLDDNSFVEIGALVTKRSTDFNLAQAEASSDGVITGECNLGAYVTGDAARHDKLRSFLTEMSW